jgi:hypothetical protein
MTGARRRGWTVRLAAAGVGLVVCTATASAQAPETVNVEVDPVTCWWRSSAAAVRSGEPFTLTLTCAVVETETTRVVPDQSKLDPSVVQLQPFEVIGGSRAPDMRVPGKRFFQYEYRLRLINEGAFGADVDVPELELSYRIESKVAQGDIVQGRDLTYNLQPISIRLLSLVPADTVDIRDLPAAAFAAVQDRESRGDMLRLVAMILFALAGVVVMTLLVTLVRRRGAAARAHAWMPPPWAIAAGVKRELDEVRQQSRGGWDTDLAGRALAALRIAASQILGRPLGQARPDAGQAPREGQLLIKGALGRRVALVSASVTTENVGDATLAESLAAFTAARYGRAPAFDASALDRALDDAIAAANRAAAEHSWIRDLLRRRFRG